MAASTISATNVILYDLWPGQARMGEQPEDGFTGSGHHNQTYEKYPAGTKFCVYDTTSRGWSTFIYLQLVDEHSTDVAAGSICSVYSTTPVYYEVTNDSASSYFTAAAVALSDFSAPTAGTTEYWGWFWCGGVCPQKHVTALATATLVTDGNVDAAGGAVILGDSGSSAVIGLLPSADASTVPICGWVLAADA